MQKITVLCVGKLKEKFYLDAVAEYTKRLQRCCKLEVIELPESKLPEEPSPAQIQQALDTEAAAISAKLPRGGALVAHVHRGQPLLQRGNEPQNAAAGGLRQDPAHLPHRRQRGPQ